MPVVFGQGMRRSGTTILLRAVATSHLFRSHPKFRERILAEDCFFTMTTDFNEWKTEVMARHLVTTRPEYAHLHVHRFRTPRDAQDFLDRLAGAS